MHLWLRRHCLARGGRHLLGKHILGPEFNPPIDPEYRELLDMDHITLCSPGP